jgi:hypothetical protein
MVQGTVYLANGQVGSGTVQVSWPAFVTAAGQAVTAGKMTVTIAPDGFVSVNLAPNLGATPAGLYYTAIYHLSDGTTSTEYWVVPSAAQASLGAVRSQLMPAAQAVQTVSKSYVDQAITELTGSLLTASGGTLSGSLYLNGDPTQSLQAADKHYVDATFSKALPLTGGALSGVLTGTNITATQLGGTYQVDQFPGADFGAKLQACVNAVSTTYGGDCDARNFTGTLAMGSNLTISTANTTVQLPCATIATANQLIVTAGTRNVALRGCALRGSSTASGNQGGTVFQYLGTGTMVQVGDPTYAADTMGFHLDNVVISTTAATSATAQGLVAYRTQEMDLESLYFLGNPNQTGMTLDGTGNYTGGTFYDNALNGFQTAVNAIGHQVTNSATTDWLNASSFVRLHIDCPTSGGSPISGTYGINLQQGDGNTFTGGDVEGCATAMHLGLNAQNNTIVGLRNENSTNQVVADAGSSYNNWMTGGTMFTGALTDNGTRNSFMDTFHRSFNGMNGDWYGSQQDATVTNHYRLGIGSANERGLLNRYQTDSGYRWTTGLSDATGGEQFYQVLDELNNVYRLSIGQYNNGQSSTNNQTVINAAGTGAVVLNGSTNAGTGGVVIGSGGASETTVATISNAGNAQLNGTLQVGGTSTLAGTPTVKNQADAEIDATLWAGLTANQKESFIYKDYNGASQWYMVKDASNNWALNSGVGGLDSFKAYQSTNSGDTYINASNSTGAVRVNYESGSGAAFNIYGGSSSYLYASFTGTTAIKLPGLAAGNGHNCLQIDNSGYITNTGAACSTGVGTVGSASAGQIAYYTANGASIGGVSAVPLTAGGTGAATAAGGLVNLGGVPLAGGTMTGALTATQFNGPLSGNATTATALAATPAQCATNKYSTGVTASGTANCSQMTYTQIGGTVPTWNQNTSGTASNVTGTVNTANGGTGATTAAGAFTNIVAPGGTMTGALTAPQFNGPLSGNVVGNLTGNVMGNVSGTASNVTGTVLVSNGGTGAATAAGALANLLPGVTTDGANGVAIGVNTQLSGTLQVGGTSTLTGTPTVKNQADTEIDATLWAGLTANQKESFIYKDYSGASQWYMVKDASNNWALNSGVGGLDSFKAYQSTNSGDTYINASNSAGAVRVNYESGSGMGFNVYGGNSNSLYASFTAPGSILFPGLAAGTGHNCLQIDSSGYITNTGSACGSVTSSNSITVSSAGAGAVAYYSGNGTSISGESAVPVTAGGTGASTAAGAVSNLLPGVAADGNRGMTVSGNVAAGTVSAKNMASIGPRYDVTQFGAAGTGYATTGTVNVSSNPNQMTVASASGFAAGQLYVIPGAGASGANLLATVTSVSGTSVYFTPAASTSVSGVTIDDTLGIQAAENTCYNNNTRPYGGVVEFPGPHAFVVNSTINIYDGCQQEGVVSGNGFTIGPNDPVALLTNFPTLPASVSFSAFTIAANSSSLETASSPYVAAPEIITVTATNSFSVNQWVLLNNCSTIGGYNINRLVGQIASVSGSQFTITSQNTFGSTGSFSGDTTCTAIPINVVMASDAQGQNSTELKISHLVISELNRHQISTTNIGVDLFYGQRLDSGSGIDDVWFDGTNPYFGVYFSNGTLDQLWTGGWRSDAQASIANIYMRGYGSDIAFHSGSITSNSYANGYNNDGILMGGGANIMVDNQACLNVNMGTRLVFQNTVMEADGNFVPGYGAVTVMHCPTNDRYPELYLTWAGSGLYSAVSNNQGTNTPFLVVSPASDVAVSLQLNNVIVAGGNGVGITPPFVGIPTLARQNMSNMMGYVNLNYSPAMYGLGFIGRTSGPGALDVPSQTLADFNFSYCWEFGIQCSTLLYSDTAFAALPNATTLEVGQILAPPAYWTNTSTNQRYALDVVKTAGTTGTPNKGWTSCENTSGARGTYTCTGPSATITATSCVSNTLTVTTTTLTDPMGGSPTFGTGYQVVIYGTQESLLNGIGGQGLTLTALAGGTSTQFQAYMYCGSLGINSADTGTAILSASQDLGIGQHVTVAGSVTNSQIDNVNASNPAAVVITLMNSGTTMSSPAYLTYSPPVLNNEIQLPTKAASAPTTGTWSQGDIVENSGATANGICGWMNIAAGTPGTWTTIPCASASGVLTPAQMGTGTPAAGEYVDGGTGAWTVLPSASSSGWKLAGPLANTGSTSGVQVGSVTIPAGTLNATSHLDIKVELDACTTSSGVPTTACTGTANTGTCTYSVKFGTSNTGGTTIIASPGPLAASRTGVLLGVIENTSASTQIGKATQISNLTYGGPPLQTTISTTGTTYLNFYVQNSVNTDTCFIDSASVTLFQ